MGKPLFTRNDENTVVGIFLVQMLDDRTIKTEVFPNMTADQVYSFTDEAKIYGR